MNRRHVAALLLLLVIAAVPRTLWLRADPPLVGGAGGVGIIWHDEGAWVHNARNRVLWGQWVTDAWNPVYVAPVFTALEYGAFSALGVGTWQARTVSVAAGLLSVGALVLGLASLVGWRAAFAGGLLLATNYVFVMWNRAALMESTMTALIVIAWAAYARGARRPAWGTVAGVATTLAWFTKASSAFFAAALAIDAVVMLARSTWLGGEPRASHAVAQRKLSAMALAGLLVSAAVIAVAFVGPHWEEYRFYNWQMSVTRKPEYSLAALIGRASWIPVVQGLFAQMTLVTIAGGIGLLSVLARWRTAAAGERLLAWWIVIGLLELTVHDSGNERRFVMFVPALVALAVVAAVSNRSAAARSLAVADWRVRVLALPVLLGTAYLVAGTAIRPLFTDQIAAGHLYLPIRVASALAAIGSAIVLVWWRTFSGIFGRRLPGALIVGGLAISIGWNTFEYARWARNRAATNVGASEALGALLEPGTLVQGKLANGLALENRIRPLFVGNGFGNYADRLVRDDARYILTYDLPSIGYESSKDSGLIQGILDHYPEHHVIAAFDVDETPERDRAVLIDKFGTDSAVHAPD